MTQTIKEIRKQYKERGVFYTEDKLSKYMHKFFDGYDVKEIYDPTCGIGNLFKFFKGAKVYGQEISEEAVKTCRATYPDSEIHCGDTLGELIYPKGRFDYIISNYPFSVKWIIDSDDDPRFEEVSVLPPESRADYAFILHCLYLLSDIGIAVVMGSPGILYRGQREGKIRKWLIENNYIEKIVQIPGNMFTDTTISTCILVMRKNKTNTDIEFIQVNNDWSEKRKQVSIQEVREQDYNLSINLYIYKKRENVFDEGTEIELHEQSRSNLKKIIEDSLKMDKMILELSSHLPQDHEQYKQELIQIITNL